MSEFAHVAKFNIFVRVAKNAMHIPHMCVNGCHDNYDPVPNTWLVRSPIKKNTIDPPAQPMNSFRHYRKVKLCGDCNKAANERGYKPFRCIDCNVPVCYDCRHDSDFRDEYGRAYLMCDKCWLVDDPTYGPTLTPEVS